MVESTVTAALFNERITARDVGGLGWASPTMTRGRPIGAWRGS